MAYVYYGATQEEVAEKYRDLGYTEEESLELALLEIDERMSDEDEEEDEQSSGQRSSGELKF